MVNDLDVVTVNLDPFWQKVPLAAAIQFVDSSYSELRSAFSTKRVVIGETGWPSDGPAEGSAIPSGENQSTYFRKFVDWAGRQNVSYYYFGAFDESWRANVYDVGAHWGLYGEDGALKPGLRGLVPVAAPDTVRERSFRDIYVGAPASHLYIGVTTSGRQSDWLMANQGTLTFQYPAQKAGGAMLFVTVGSSMPPGSRLSIDLSRYRSLVVDMRRLSGSGNCVDLGIKDSTQPDDGTETTVEHCMANSEWSTVIVPLSAFKPANLTQLYVVFEVVFPTVPIAIQLRNIRYSSM